MTGNLIITLALLASVFSVGMYYLTIRGYENTLKLARISYHTMTLLVLTASALLIYAILNHQYEYSYVYNYSGSGLSLGLLLSTFYAGQEGSFLLWILFTSLTGVFLIDFTSKRENLEPQVMMIFSLTLTFLLIMVNPLLKSPFNYIWADPSFIDIKNISKSYLQLPFLQQHFFQDQNSDTGYIRMSAEVAALLKSGGISVNEFIVNGKGLNPLLQNFWMQIHPPMLFVGFAMSTVPFAFAFAALIKNEYRSWVNHSLPWVLAGAMVLGLAIMLGGYWAYGVLGWGGYWGWDPVENSSLVPWIVAVALIHTLLVQKRSQQSGKPPRFVKTNLILAIFTFLLVLYSTFLTRSGILGDSSVHSFVDPGMLVYLFLIAFVGFYTLLGLGGIAYRWKFLNENFTFEENVLSRELALFTGAVALIASAIIITVGTSAPIFGQSVETRFYNELNLPIAIIIGIVNGLGLFLRWKQTKGISLFKSLRLSFGLTLAATLLVVFIGGVYNLMLIIFTFATLFSLISNLETAANIVRKKPSYIGPYVTHAGIALFFLGVIATGGFTSEKQVDLVKGEKQNVFGYDLTFTGWSPFANGKKYHFNVSIDNGGSEIVASPVMYISDFNNELWREPDIKNLVTRDFYISPIGYNDNSSGDDGGHGTHASLNKGESFNFEGKEITFVGFDFGEDEMSSMMGGGEFSIMANLIINFNGKTVQVQPGLQFSGQNKRVSIPAELTDANLKIDVENLDAGGKVDLLFSKFEGDNSSISPKETKEILTINASLKPFINLVWLGVFVMVVGFIISILRRTKEMQAK